MGIERKRSPARDLNINADASFATATASSSSSAAPFSRNNFTNRSATLPPPRSNSPPASVYFSQFSVDDSHVGLPNPDASSHFAYSTTLRRHHVDGPLGFPSPSHGNALPTLQELRSVVAEEGPSGLLDRGVRTVKSLFPSRSSDYERLPTHREEHQETPSAIFAHRSVEVCRYPCRFDA